MQRSSSRHTTKIWRFQNTSSKLSVKRTRNVSLRTTSINTMPPEVSKRYTPYSVTSGMAIHGAKSESRNAKNGNAPIAVWKMLRSLLSAATDSEKRRDAAGPWTMTISSLYGANIQPTTPDQNGIGTHWGEGGKDTFG